MDATCLAWPPPPHLTSPQSRSKSPGDISCYITFLLLNFHGVYCRNFVSFSICKGQSCQTKNSHKSSRARVIEYSVFDSIAYVKDQGCFSLNVMSAEFGTLLAAP